MTVRRLPRIGEIQRTTALLAVAVAGLLWWIDSRAAAMACVLGGIVAMANLYALAAVAKLVIAAGRGGGVARLTVIAAPLKLLLIIGLAYLILTTMRPNLIGLALGFLTQLGAILIETGRLAAFSLAEDRS